MTRNRALSLTLFILLVVPVAFSQQMPPMLPSPRTIVIGRGVDGFGSNMGIVPSGTWWKNPDTIASLGLTADQQKKMDDLFLQSRIALIHLHASLDEEQLKLEPLLDSNPPDQVKSLAEISKIADLRADLEKANAKMLLGLRSVLTADQWTKLQADQHARRDRTKDKDKEIRIERGQDRGPKGPQGSQGQQGPRGPQPPPPATAAPPPVE